MKPADLPESHEFHLTQGEMDCLVALVAGLTVLAADASIGALVTRGLTRVIDAIIDDEPLDPLDLPWRVAAITDSGRQCLALHEAMQ